MLAYSDAATDPRCLRSSVYAHFPETYTQKVAQLLQDYRKVNTVLLLKRAVLSAEQAHTMSATRRYLPGLGNEAMASFLVVFKYVTYKLAPCSKVGTTITCKFR